MLSRIAASLRLVSWLLLLLALVSAACSGGDDEDAAEPLAPTVAPSPEPTSGEPTGGPAEDDEPTPTASEPATIEDQGLATLITLDAAEPVEDRVGNLVTIHGAAVWPDAYAAIEPFSRDDVELFGDLEREWSEPGALAALDVAICAAGLSSETPAGAVDFFVAGDTGALLDDDRTSGASLAIGFPVVTPPLAFPDPGECSRGWVPVAWSGEGTPAVGRYVLTLSDDDAESARHLYQWAVTPSEPPEVDRFQAGQVVTFNDGDLDGASVLVRGWAEVVDAEPPAPGTRLVAVSMKVCEGSAEVRPGLGLEVDGWNLAGSTDTHDLPSAIEPIEDEPGCFEGWVGFQVPNGGRPTGLFATDRTDPVQGYASWSLAGAALPEPQ